jgi:hypothetical protein
MYPGVIPGHQFHRRIMSPKADTDIETDSDPDSGSSRRLTAKMRVSYSLL